MKDLKFIPHIIIAATFIALFYFGWDRIKSGTTFEHVGAIVSGLVAAIAVYMALKFNRDGTRINDDQATIIEVVGGLALVAMVCFLLQVF